MSLLVMWLYVCAVMATRLVGHNLVWDGHHLESEVSEWFGTGEAATIYCSTVWTLPHPLSNRAFALLLSQYHVACTPSSSASPLSPGLWALCDPSCESNLCCEFVHVAAWCGTSLTALYLCTLRWPFFILYISVTGEHEQALRVCS